MPTVRYEIRSEYSLADPAVYGAAEKDDPEAVLEAVAMAGLVGLLRQLGDLAEFGAEIFHDLHEEVMATASRGHGLTLRLKQIEAEFPTLENSLVSKISLPNVLQNDGVEFHANIQTDRNLITSGDMPRFIMDSYEECRGPPRLFALDKFDVAGAGACLKRYSDPSFFKTEISKSSDLIETEDPREKKPRKIKKNAIRVRKGETLESLLISSSESQSRIENQALIVRRVKLKSRKSQNSESNTNARKIQHSILVGLIESQQKILQSDSEKDLFFKKEESGMIMKPEGLLNKALDYVEERESNVEAQKMRKIFPIQEQNDFSSEYDKIETEKDNENEKCSSLYQTKEKNLGDSDELENFVDALNSIDSETESENKKHKSDSIIRINSNEGLESSLEKEIISNHNNVSLENEFDEANEEFFDDDDLMDVSSTSSLHSELNQNDLMHKSELNDSNDFHALSDNETEKAQENLEDLYVEKERNLNDSCEELEIPILNSEEVGISDEAWIEKESIVSNAEETKSTNESINGEDSSIQNKEGKFISDDIISEGLEDSNSSVNKLEEINEIHNEVSQVELRNISDEILNLEEYLISNRDYDNIERNNESSIGQEQSHPLNEIDEPLVDSQSEKIQNYKSDESFNHEDLISFREDESERFESGENAVYLPEENFEETLIQPNENFEETLIQPNENFEETLIQPKDYSKEPCSPNSRTEPVGALLGFEETLNPKQQENSLKTLDSFEEIQQQHEKDWQEYLFEEESKVDSVKHTQQNDFKNNFNLLDEKYSKNPFETNTHLQENAPNNQNLIQWSDNEEEYETLEGEFNAGVKQEFLVSNDFLWEPASPPRESTIEQSSRINQDCEHGSPTVSVDQVHHGPDKFSDDKSEKEVSDEFGLQDPSVDRVHELLQIDSEIKACESEVIMESLDKKEEEYLDSGLASLDLVDQDELWDIADPPVDQVLDLSGISDPYMDQVHEPSYVSDPLVDQVLEPSDLSDPYMDQVHEPHPLVDQILEPSDLSDRSMDQVHEPSHLSDPSLNQVHEQSIVEDLDSKSNESLSEKDGIEPGFFPTVSVGFSHEQSGLSNEIKNISQSEEEEEEEEKEKNVPSINLGFSNKKLEEEKEDLDIKPHDFSHESCTIEKPIINETDERPLTNTLSTTFVDISDTSPNPNNPSIQPIPNPSFPSIDTKPNPSSSNPNLSSIDPNPNFPSLNPNPNPSNPNLSSIFSSISQNPNSASENEDKPPPLPPLGWRLGGKLRKGISLPSNGFLTGSNPDPFGELDCVFEPKQDDIGNDLSMFIQPANVPDPFVEIESKQDDIIANDLDLSKPVNDPFESADDSQKLERENGKEKESVVSLFDLVPPILNPNPQAEPFLGQSNIQNPENDISPNPDPITILPTISNPNLQEDHKQDPIPDPTINPQNPNPDPIPPPILNPNYPPIPYSLQNPDPNPPNPNLFLPVPTWSSVPAHHPPGYLILEEDLWARYGIDPTFNNTNNNKTYSIRNIPRNPLMDAVAAHDRTTMRKVSELIKPTDESKSDERNSMLEQIRNKSFSLRPVSAPKTTAVKATPQTNLKVAAIVEKANAIRQACVGSDEEDSWSDA